MELTTEGLIAPTIAVVVGFLFGIAVSFGSANKRVTGWTTFEHLRDRVFVALPFALAFYLMVISIVATQVFDQTFAAPDEPGARLQRSLDASANLSQGAPESLQEMSMPDDFDAVIPSAINEVNADLAGYAKSATGQINNYRRILEAQPKGYGPKTTEEIKLLTQQFDLQDHGHLGTHLTEAHVDKLIEFFGGWISAWTTAAKGCRDTINAEQTRFAALVEDVKAVLKNGGDNFPYFGTDSLPGPALARACDFDAALSNSEMPSRSTTDPSLSLFGTMAGWLLATESRDLTLITGLLGFGLFGALSASFIRPDIAAANPQGANGTYNSVFIRGIAAAVLVYLVVVGGLAVFTRGSTPNPYAVYFACFVAAVFSEDVWDWARRRQQEDFDLAEPKAPPAPKPS
jgi:hypothetical protein